jgi:hypothetical protein
MPVTIAQITAAFDFANTGSSMGAFFAVVCKATGEIHYQTDMPDFADMYDELPDDIDDEEKYVALRTSVNWDSASRWCWILPATPCRTISILSAISSTGGGLSQIQGPARQTRCD